MSDARWFEVDQDVAAGMLHFRRSAELYAANGFEREGLEGYRAQMAFMHAMQSGHISVEAALVRILDMLGEERPTGSDCHATLIGRLSASSSGRPALLDAVLAAALQETRRFRHVAMRSYGQLRPEAARPAVQAAGIVVGQLQDAVQEFRAVIDP